MQIARALEESKLEAVLIGNAAAALNGAPVTTVDFDFMFRCTPSNLAKLKRVAASLEATIFRPYYPASGLFRLINDDRGLQVDFMARVDGIKSLASLRSRAQEMTIGGVALWVASMADVIASKRAADRPRDRAVLEILEKTLRETPKAEKEKRSSPRK